MLLGMWPGDDVDPLVSPSFDIKDRERLLQVIISISNQLIFLPSNK